MATSYPRRTTSGGIWKVTDVAKNLLTKGTWPANPTPGGRGVFGGQYTPSIAGAIEYVNISSTGDVTDFGDMSSARYYAGSASSFTRGVIGGGWVGGSSPYTTVTMDYVTTASTGNAADFGDLTVTRQGLPGSSISSSTRGVFMGGYSYGPNEAKDTIDYITIASTGNAIDFGNLLAAQTYGAGACSPTRALVAGGGSSDTNVIQFVEIATTGNAVDFGDLLRNDTLVGNSSATRVVFAGGVSPAYVNTIQYATIAAKGNTTDFGDLTVARSRMGGANNSVRAVWAGGMSPGVLNTIDYITIATSGNATDFGDVSTASAKAAGMSDSHGGLEAYDPRLIPVGSGRALIAGFYTPTVTGQIDFFNVGTLGNAADFGDLVLAKYNMHSYSSSTRGIFAGGHPSFSNTIQSIEMHSLGNTSDFGDLTEGKNAAAGCSSSTRGIASAGRSGPGGGGLTNVIDYITIATAGNATDFGDSTEARERVRGAGSSTRGIFMGGQNPSASNVMDYITIAATSNATDFGDLTAAGYGLACVSSSTRQVAGGAMSPASDVIEYVTISSTGDMTDFGNLTDSRGTAAGATNTVRGCFGGGYDPTRKNTIDYITIATTGDAADFGDLTAVTSDVVAASDIHGGITS